MQLRQLETYLWSLFDSCRCDDDMSNNGLQVEASCEISKVAFAVDACKESLLGAADAGAQLLVVHHGISWHDGFRRVRGADAERFRIMFTRGVSLFAMHLPLDGHVELGNNAVIAKKIGLQEKKPFCMYKGLPIGCAGRSPFTSLSELKQAIVSCGIAPEVSLYDNSQGVVGTLGIVSGSCGNMFEYCKEQGVNCLITGEIGHAEYHSARENGVSVLSCGHYASEVWGVRALMPLIKDLGLDVTFIDVPTGL